MQTIFYSIVGGISVLAIWAGIVCLYKRIKSQKPSPFRAFIMSYAFCVLAAFGIGFTCTYATAPLQLLPVIYIVIHLLALALNGRNLFSMFASAVQKSDKLSDGNPDNSANDS